MVFDGDWNGGERVFRVDPDEELELRSITRLDPATGDEHRLVEDSSLSEVDRYGWSGRNQLRWRVRNPSDPPLQNRELTYVLDYTLRDILVRGRDGTYVLSHDFAFPDRPGDIERFSLRLDLDPAWTTSAATRLTVSGVRLPPGASHVVRLPLTHQGTAPPTSLSSGPSPLAGIVRVALFLLLLLGASLMLRRFIASERAAGRYRSVTATRKWLDEHIFSLRPEVVGASWDHTTSNAEVAALLALMSLEGKIRQTRTGANPELALLVSRDTLSSYERAFVDQLFVLGDRIDPETLRLYYKSTGFDPSNALRQPLDHAARKLVGGSPMWASCGLGLAAAALAFVILPAAASIAGGGTLRILGFVAAAGMIATTILGISYQARLRGTRAAQAIAIPAVVVAALAIIFSAGIVGATLYTAVALIMLQLGLHIGRWKGAPEHLERLQNLMAGRRFFEKALRRRDPAIEDHWIPYMLAFDLGPAVDQWSISAPSSSLRSTSSGSSSGSSSGPGTSFGGGGGGFGGAGATGGWASGLASFAASVPSPSSSSGSGGSSSGSSGGSSSGGGGGGGW